MQGLGTGSSYRSGSSLLLLILGIFAMSFLFYFSRRHSNNTAASNPTFQNIEVSNEIKNAETPKAMENAVQNNLNDVEKQDQNRLDHINEESDSHK